MTSLSTMPRVSVLMSTHNASPYLQASVESILGQTFQDYEFLIIDDASTDETWNKLERYAKRDERIRLFRNPTNLGLPTSLNRIVPKARAQYIARMDADDIATPDRFAIQIEVLDRGDADICAGSFIEFPASRIRVRGALMEDDEFKIGLLFEWSIMHPTVMLRSTLLRGEKYRPDMVPAADYDLWVRLSKMARVRNLPEVLLLKRVHPTQISSVHAANQLSAAMSVRRMALENIGIEASTREIYLQSQVWTPEKPSNWQEAVDTEAWLARLSKALATRAAAKPHLSKRWYVYCLKAAPYGLKSYRLFKRSALYRLQRYSAAQRLAAWFLCLFRIPYQSKSFWILTSLHPAARKKRDEVRKLPPDMRELLHY